MKTILRLSLIGLLGASALGQHLPGYNYDEAKIPPYTLLDPLKMDDGRAVTTKAQWWDKRRPEIMRIFEENEFGVTPADAKVPLRVKVIEMDPHALGGLAIRKQIDVYFSAKGADGPKMRVLLYLPAKAKGRSPLVVGLNFNGNQTVVADPGILPTDIWIKPKPENVLKHVKPEESTRGSQTQEWQVEKVVGRGYGLATIYYGDLEPDFKDSSEFSVRQLFTKSGKPDEWGALGTWAWGLSRAVDYLETDKQVDAKHIAVTGHSRLGKAADWAAAQDTRFTAVLSTESGHGGQSIQRRALGENVQHLEVSFPYWFCPAYAKWVGHDQEIPADGNLLLSLMAPRPLYVASAVGDEWSDPKGEFMSAVSASRVYALLGRKGIPSETMPGINQAVHSAGFAIGYHDRTGKHDVTAFDWEQYLDFLDEHFGKPVLP